MRAVFLAGFFLLALYACRRHRPGWGVVAAGTGIWLVGYFNATKDWLGGLGADSLSEAQKFSWEEAGFFLETLRSILEPASLHGWLEAIGIAAGSTAVVAGLLWWALRQFKRPDIERWFDRMIGLLACICIVQPIAVQADHLSQKFKSNTAVYDGVRKNFEGNEQHLTLTPVGNPGMRVVVYIGESTTAMHWGLYGYPLNTTPRLSAFAKTDPGLLVFRHVVSTHTHTSQSLLEALSFGMPGSSEYQPIANCKRASLVGVLDRLDISTELLSTQGAAGTWNLASSIVFSRATSQKYSSPLAVFLGNHDPEGHLYDGVFFKNALKKFDAFRPHGSAVEFLHSYAGHGPYAENIPKSADRPAPPFFNGATPSLVYGNRVADRNTQRITHYDDAMRYIDSNVAHVMQQVANDSRPTAMLYFSDHGDAVGTGAGHDSSRFEHEMTRVPFLMYFNDAARQANPGLFATFQDAARAGRPSTLAQVSATIMALLGYRVEGDARNYRGIGLDPESALPPIVVRQLGAVTTYVRSHGDARGHRADTRDATDPATTIWLNSKTGTPQQSNKPALCYGSANTWAKANRGAMVADCLAVRLAASGNQLDAAPAEKGADGWALSAIARVATAHKMSLWLDGSGLPAGRVCADVQAWRRQLEPPSGEAAPNAQAHDTPSLGAKQEIHGKPAGTALPKPLVVELTPHADSPLPAACAALQTQGAMLLLHVPDSIANGKTDAAAWARSMTSNGWPAHYSLHTPPDTRAMESLLSTPRAMWALGGVPVNALPWKGNRALPTPAMLNVETGWDLNSRG